MINVNHLVVHIYETKLVRKCYKYEVDHIIRYWIFSRRMENKTEGYFTNLFIACHKDKD